MWFVVSTPDENSLDDEQIWECPANWIINNVLHYPPDDGKKSRKTLLERIKQQEAPKSDWVKTSIYKFVKTKEGVSTFGKYNLNKQ